MNDWEIKRELTITMDQTHHDSPLLGVLLSALSWFITVINFTMDHADMAGKLITFVLSCTVSAVMIRYYVLQNRKLKREK